MILALSNYEPPTGTQSWLSVLFYLIAIITAAVVLWRQFRPSPLTPQPLQIIGTTRQATYNELKQLRSELEEHKRISEQHQISAAQRFRVIEHKIEEHYLQIMKAGEDRKEEIFTRINSINDNITERISRIGMEQSNAIGELRGEIRRIK